MKTLTVGDIYAIWNGEIEKWSLLQVIEQNEKKEFILLDLDQFYDKIPEENELVALKALMINHHRWTGMYSYARTKQDEVPESVVFVQNLAPIVTVRQIKENHTSNHSFSAWEANELQRILQYYWLQLPETVIEAFKRAIFPTVKEGERVPYVGSHRFIEEADNYDLAKLDEFFQIYDIRFTGKSSDLIRKYEERALFTHLEWKQHGQKVVDLSNTHLLSLEIDATGLEKLILNKRIREVRLTGDLSQLNNLQVIHPRQGKFIDLTIFSEKNFEIPDLNLPQLSRLSLKLDAIDLKQIRAYYPHLQNLSCWGNPGVLSNIQALCGFKSIVSVFLCDLFEFAASDFPQPEELPGLESLVLSSIPREVGVHVKQHFKHLPYLDVRKLRNDKWLTENLHNPFRGWDGRDGISAAHAKKAANAFKKLNTAIDKNTDKQVLIAAFVEFVQVFNGIQKKSKIETMEVDELTKVYMDLAKKAALDVKEMYTLLENEIDF